MGKMPSNKPPWLSSLLTFRDLRLVSNPHVTYSDNELGFHGQNVCDTHEKLLFLRITVTNRLIQTFLCSSVSFPSNSPLLVRTVDIS